MDLDKKNKILEDGILDKHEEFKISESTTVSLATPTTKGN